MQPTNNQAEADALKLIQELEVVKDELFRQNEELKMALANAETATALYDFAPSGYFTLDSEGNISELNLSGALMLGKQRSQLFNANFKFFISNNTLLAFNDFLKKIFNSKIKQTCEIQLSIGDKASIVLQVEGIILFQDMRKCLITAVDITKLKQSEEDLRESVYFFRESQKAAFIGSYKTDFISGYWESSEVMDQIFGIDKSYIRSVQGWLDLVHPDDKEMMNNHLQIHVIKYRNPFNKEYRIVRKSDGEIRWLHGLGEVTFDDRGNALSLIGTIQDITERHEIEAVLIQSEKRYKLLAENTKDVIWVLDPETMSLLYVSPSCEQLLGYTPLELLNTPFEMTLIPEIREFFIQRTRDRVVEYSCNPIPGTGYQNEVVHLRKDGTVIVTEVVNNYYVNKNTGKVEIQGVSRDITKQKQAELALKQSEENARKNNDLLRSIFESSHGLIIFALNLELRYTAFTFSHRETMKAIYGVDIEVGMYMPDLIVEEEDKRRTLTYYNRVLQGEHFIEVEEFGDEDFRWILWETRYSPIYDDKHSIVGLTVFVTDITDRKRFEETLKANETRLHDLNATKDKFFSIIAHDLKNPFNAVIGFSNLLIDQVKENDYNGIDEYATIIKDSSLRAMSLLNNLLIWARSQTGKMEFNPENFELVKLIGEVIELLNDSAKQKKIEILLQLPYDVVVFADKEMIGTILRNLISNAVKFTHSGGMITISVHLQVEGSLIQVSDNGMGIKKENIHKLFKIDESYSTKGTQNESGTGLGLLLCKEFIEKNGGKIWAESEYGKGSKFSFLIPK